MGEAIPRNDWRDGFVGLLTAARGMDPARGERLPDGGWRAAADGPPVSVLYYYPGLPSTNVRLRELAAAGAPAGALVLAGQQSAGRGRHGRGWYSPPGGGIYASLLLDPGLDTDRLGWLTLAAALALVRAGRVLGCDLRIKWPNDVRCEGRKVAGVLAEAVSEGGRIGTVVLGTGVNVTWQAGQVPEELRGTATALSLCGALSPDRDGLLADYLWELYALLPGLAEERKGGREGTPSIAAEVLARMEHLGEQVRVRQGAGAVTGICTGLTAEGYLELDGGRAVAGGELVTMLQEGGD